MDQYPSYAIEKFTRAANTLATGAGDARSRVRDAFIWHLIGVKPHYLPNDLADSFSKVVDRLTKYPGELSGEGSVHASTRRMINSTAARLAETIYNIHCELEDRYRS